MDGPRVVTQCSKSERERKIPYDTSFMWSLKKTGTSKSIRKMESHRYGKQAYGYPGEQGLNKLESGTDRYVLLYIK